MPFINMTTSARMLFEAKGVGSNSWNIPSAEEYRIANHRIIIAIFSPPASALDLQASLPPNDLRHLIIIDIDLLRQREITAQQLQAILLHEIGHIVNPPPASRGNNMESENYADDYVRYCGYGSDFATALEHMRDIGVRGFESSSVNTRISQLNENTEPMLNLQTG